jgi:hypothetical protein
VDTSGLPGFEVDRLGAANYQDLFSFDPDNPSLIGTLAFERMFFELDEPTGQVIPEAGSLTVLGFVIPAGFAAWRRFRGIG